jgi:bifunctional UDP-N-acetylglucosamine pyrophosphorylase/glucosamine-1-phosphate N-acetyltransferase
VIVLAAGEGTRMKSATRPKVLHGFAGRSLLGHVLAATAGLEPTRTAVVIGHHRDLVGEHLAATYPDAKAVVQDVQHGTGHAVRIALESIEGIENTGGTVLVVPGDAPLLQTQTLADLLARHLASGAAATMLTSPAPDPTGYGRVIRGPGGAVVKVVEEKDATAEERTVDEVSALVYAFDAALLRDAVGRLSRDNAQGEEYLPDVIGIFVSEGRQVGAVLAPATETAGVNDRVQLAVARRVYNDRLLEQHMRAGVTVVDPATTWIDADVCIESDAELLPNVQLAGRTSIGAGSMVGPDCTLTDTEVGPGCILNRTVAVNAVIGTGATVGPFAYLRPGTVLGEGAHVGTYVEIKGSDVGRGTKVPHLTYVGDASIGEFTNIGAATVFVNYDGINKHRSVIGNHARTGADNMFVAPVVVGDGAYTAAGSVITSDVPPGALALGRARQQNVAGWVKRKRPGTPAAAAAEAAEAAETSQASKASQGDQNPGQAAQPPLPDNGLS